MAREAELAGPAPGALLLVRLAWPAIEALEAAALAAAAAAAAAAATAAAQTRLKGKLRGAALLGDAKALGGEAKHGAKVPRASCRGVFDFIRLGLRWPLILCSHDAPFDHGPSTCAL